MLSENHWCFICGNPKGLEKHHCISGTANRKLADKPEYDLTVWLCHQCHRDLHDKGFYKRELQQYAQKHFEKTHSREEFRKIFGRSYL